MTIESALLLLRPGARWTLFGNSYDGLIWQDSTSMPTREEVDQMMLLPEPLPVPQEVPRWALREICLIRGLIPAIEAELQELPEPDRSVAMNRWSEKPTIERQSPLITALQGRLGWTDAYVDELFRAANQRGS
jgi:hypothetical protein